MKKALISTIIFISCLLLVITVGLITINLKQNKKANLLNNNETETTNTNKEEKNQKSMKAVIIKVNKNNLMVMQEDEEKTLTILNFSEEENKNFKEKQEILVYYNDDYIDLTYPVPINDISKIEIINEYSDIEIPTKYISSKNNIKISVDEITNTKLAINITDTNEQQYNYPNSYKIQKKTKNENYTGKNEKIGQDTETELSSYTRNRSRIYLWRNE